MKRVALFLKVGFICSAAEHRSLQSTTSFKVSDVHGLLVCLLWQVVQNWLGEVEK